MVKSTYDKIENNYSKQEKRNNWETGIGLNKVDGLVPSEYLQELIEEFVEEKSTYKEIENKLNIYYKNRDLSDRNERDTRECDFVTARIAELLQDGTFIFSPVYLKSIHRYLFKDIFYSELKDYAGEFRDYNISKKETILKGETVIYGNYQDLMEYLKYDFDEEKKVDYTKLNEEEQIKRIAKFTSAIWQVHPFVEGNTRTTAVFIEKYLRTKGFNINNDLFKEYSVYFRNALVLSNYSNISLKISADFRYLNSFFRKLLINPKENLEQAEKLNSF